MRNKLIISAIIAANIVVLLALYGSRNNVGGTSYTNVRTSTASSSVMEIGDQLSKIVLSSYGRRFYASLCNTGTQGATGNKIFLSFSGTAITATTSADYPINAGECYEISGDNLYTGEVQAISEAATTSDVFLVSELRY